MPRNLKNTPSLFCYVYGSFTIKPQQLNIAPDLKKVQKLHFVCLLGKQRKQWALH